MSLSGKFILEEKMEISKYEGSSWHEVNTYLLMVNIFQKYIISLLYPDLQIIFFLVGHGSVKHWALN